MSPRPKISIHRMPSSSLPHYPRLDALVALVNTAFMTSWATIDGLVGPEATRYESSMQFAEEMGEGGVTWVAVEGGEEGKEDGKEGEGKGEGQGEGEGRIVATAGYKRWDDVWKVADRMEVPGVAGVPTEEAEPNQSADADCEKYELVVVAVDPTVQKSGLASRLCDEVEKELKEKVRAMGKRRLKMLIRTGKENNETYWTRKGYRFVSEMKFPPGNFGSRTGFTVLQMERVIKL